MVVIVPEPQAIEHGTLKLNINVSAEARITANEARREVSGYVLSYISNLMHGAEPSLVLDKQIYWRVPVILSHPPHGDRGQVGEIDVDIETGKLLVDDEIIAEITARAQYLIASST